MYDPSLPYTGFLASASIAGVSLGLGWVALAGFALVAAGLALFRMTPRREA